SNRLDHHTGVSYGMTPSLPSVAPALLRSKSPTGAKSITLTHMDLRASSMVRTSPSRSHVRPESRTSCGQPVRQTGPRSPLKFRESGAFQLPAVADALPTSVDCARCSSGTRIDHGGTRRSMRATGSNTWTLVGERAAKAHQASKYLAASAASSGLSSTATPISFTCVIDFQSMLVDPR